MIVIRSIGGIERAMNEPASASLMASGFMNAPTGGVTFETQFLEPRTT
jgi:hypothetical protein